ncbi:3 -5 exonuclease, partial [Cystoisospora suis]
MSSYTVDHLFLELLKDPGGNAYEAIRWARLISDFEEVSSLQTLLKSSRWSLEEVLASVSSRRSENLLRAFFDGFLLGDVNEERRLEEKEEKKKRGRKDPWSVDGGEGLMFSGASEGEEREEKNEMIKSSMEIKMKEEEEEDEEERERRERLMIDACEWLARKCPETGTIVDPWGYLASRTVATRLFSRNLYDLSSSLFSDTHTRRRLRDTSIIERERGEEEEEKIGEQKNLSRRSTTDVSSLISSAASSSSVMSTQGNTATKSEREKKLIGKQDYEEEISLPQTEEGLYSSLPFSSIERDRDPGLPDSPSPSSSQTSHEVCTVFLSRGAASSLTERKEDKELKVRLREQEEREKGREVDVEEGTLITLPSAYTDCDIDSPYRHMESEFEDTRSYLESVSWHLADKEDAEEDNEKRRREEEEGFFLHPLSPLSPGVSTPGGARNTSSPSLEEEEIKHKRRETRIEDDLSSPNTDRDNLLSLDSSLPSSSSLYTIPPSPFPPSSSSASPSVRPADRSTGNRVYPSFRLSPELLRDSLLFIDDTESLGSAFEYIRVSQESFCSDMRYQDQGVYSSHPTSSSSSCSSSPLSCVSVLNRGKEKKDRSLCDLKKDKRSASEVSPLIERSGDPDPSMTGTPAEHLDTSHTPASPPSPCSSCSPPSSSSASSSLIPPLPAWMVPFHPFVVALDLEWSLPHAASILTLATENRVYIIDVTNQDLLYQKTLLHMLRWVFGNPFILKLMYQGGQDLLKLFFHLRSAGRPGRLVHCVDLRQPRVLMERRGRRDGRRMHPPSPPPLHSSSSDLNTCREKSSPSHDRREQPHCSLHDGSCLNHDIKRQEDPPSSPYLGTEDFTLLGHEDTGDRYLTDGISDEGTTSVYTASSSTETEVNPEKQENGEGTRAHKKKEEEKKQRQFGEVKVGRKGRWSLEEEDEEEEVLPGEKGAIPRKL